MSGRKTINDFLSEDLIDITQLLTLALGQKKDQLYTKWTWKWVMMIIKMIPEFKFKKINL